MAMAGAALVVAGVLTALEGNDDAAARAWSTPGPWAWVAAAWAPVSASALALQMGPLEAAGQGRRPSDGSDVP